MIYMVITTPFGGLGLDMDKFFSTTHTTPTYPPHNVIKFSDNDYVLQFAVAGFKKEDVEVVSENGTLSISGQKKDPEIEDGAGYVHKGIATRKFVRRFTLPEYFEVSGAHMEDGILSVSLFRNVPEAQKPRTIEIN
jgi:molecular chaperone IbpA